MVSAIGFIALNVPKQKDLPPATAPLVWLHPEDTYFPSDIAAQLLHTKPQINFADVPGYPNPLTLENLDSLNANKGSDVYLTSVDDLTTAPAWLNGVKPDKSHTTVGAISATVIVNDRGNGQVDAFYMYFNAYNYGGRILGQNVNEHVGVCLHLRFPFGMLADRAKGLGTQHDPLHQRKTSRSMVQPARLR